ncbi:DNA polymerase III subunit alpha [Lactococcus ileimucosae]|uniref:DNA polymerase III subunit alpha n=1 Tax=Lactococcus ileimucosae TaxID=2941329 RepID=UPI002043B159|nr:DNA polymerase III subunit alpha [Lactococcus ileimucosae]
MFAQLNTKTEYSFLDSVVRVQDYLRIAEKQGYKQLGICDVGNLHGAYRFAIEAQKRNLQPIIGIELVFELENLPVSVRFIAKNTEGYKNLLKISSSHNYGRRRFSDIEGLLNNVALVVPESYANLSVWSQIQAEIYVGISTHTTGEMSFKLPALPFQPVRYLTLSDNESLEVLHAIRDLRPYDQSLTLSNDQLLQRPEFYENFYRQNNPQALANLEHLVQDISYDFSEKLELPQFDRTRNAAELLRETAEANLPEGKVYRERLNHELSVIHQMGFDDYFLIVADLLRYASENNIYCGMGRGSAAGSLVAYTLGITHVDPVANNLFFERFLNPERVAMPDIDIDMPDTKRSDLLAYMKRRYGSDHVAQIVTFSTLGKRQALRDVGKAFGMNEAELSNLTRMLVNRFGSLRDEYEENPKLKSEILRDGRLQRVYEVACRIEGLPRQTSTHASGVVLSQESLVNYVPLKPSDDLALTQYEAPDIEEIGLLKIDFLGLRNLTIVERLSELVEKRKNISIDPLKINLEDEKTLALFRAGNTLGIFQFENPQMRRFLRNLAPTKFEDIVDATSIFRPGPSQFIPEFVARRHGQEEIEVIDDTLTDILAPTYGIMIYQEQIMQVAQRFAGFSLGKADVLRRAISKKKGKEFEELQAEFLAGSLKMGHTEEKASEIYRLIERFANYGFNRSHAYAYAALAFQIAYFKTNYPDEFYEVQLRDRKRETMIQDALDNAFQMERPVINRMPYHDRVENKKIALGLANVRTVPRDMAFWIVENRPFADLSELVKKLPQNFQKQEYLLPLIQIGAFDDQEKNRGKLAKNLPALIDYTQNIQLDLFGDSALKFSYQEAEDYLQSEKYEFEKHFMGVGITPHPLQTLALKLKGHFTYIQDLQKNKRAVILVELLSIRTHRTKNGETMAFLAGTDSKENFDITFFPENYRRYMADLEKGKFYLISGKITERNENLQMIADRITEVEDTQRKLWLNLADTRHNKNVSRILRDFPGAIQVILHFADTKKTTQTQVYVEESELLLKKLEAYVLNAVYK